MAFQRDVLLDWRTILDNVLLSIEFTRKPRAEERDRAMALIDLFGLKGFEHRFPWQLSGGMRQRVSICRARCWPIPNGFDGRTVRRARCHDAG